MISVCCKAHTYTAQHKLNKGRHTSMPWVELTSTLCQCSIGRRQRGHGDRQPVILLTVNQTWVVPVLSNDRSIAENDKVNLITRPSRRGLRIK
jgi:hypothetical protein